MIAVAEWLRRETEPLMRAHIGRDLGDQVDPLLGHGIYGYFDDRMNIQLFDNGIRFAGPSGNYSWRYDQIDSLRLMSMKDLVGMRSPDSDATLVICVNDDVFDLLLPYKVYSTISTALVRIVRQGS